MPSYEALCHKCGTYHTYYRTIADYKNTPICCGEKTEKVILTAPKGYVQADICYDSPIDGRPITTKQARIEDLKRSGSRPWEGMETEQQEAKRQLEYQEKELDKAAENAAIEAWKALPDPHKKTLAQAA